MSMSKGGMQSAGIKTMYCKCGKETSRTLILSNEKEISIHFTRKGTYWHICENGKIRRVFLMPEEWKNM